MRQSNHLVLLFLISLIVFPIRCYSIDYDTVAAKRVSESTYWYRLLHYKKGFFGGVKSFNDQEEFFISPDGKDNPYQELIATIEAFQNDRVDYGRIKKSAQCVFPERYRYLKKTLKLDILDKACPDFRQWKAGLNVGKLSLVFSSAYANNPASLFGHTFIRLHNKNKSAHDLLDYSVGFAADADFSGIGIEYMVFGLLGGYRGYFLVEPYSQKVTEYNSSESRDLWEFELKLSDEQIERFVNHLWEVYSAAGFDYFFIDENCSFHLLSLLEVANPEWELLSEFNTFTMPADTIKILINEKAVEEPLFRPSNLKVLHAKVNALSEQDRIEYEKIIDREIEPKESKNPQALDAAVSNIYYYKYKEGQKFKDAKFFRKLLISRSKVGKAFIPEIKENQKRNRPDWGHDSTKVSISGGEIFNSSFIGLNLRGGLQDLLNYDLGYEVFSEIKFFDINTQYLIDEKKMSIKEFVFFSLKSLYPFNSFDRKISWNVYSGAKRIIDAGCLRCTAVHLEGGPGLTFSFLKNRLSVYSFFNWFHQFSGRFSNNMRMGPKLNAGILGQIGSRLKVRGEINSFYDLKKNYKRNADVEYRFGLAYHLSQNVETRINYNLLESLSESESSLGISYFY